MTRLDVLGEAIPLIAILVGSIIKVDACALAWAELDIQYPGCFPRRLLVKGCRGGCSTYTMPSQNIPGQLERFCQCCDVDDMRLRRARIRCINTDTSPIQIRGRAVTMKIPQSCRCRPCTDIIPEHVIPAEQEFLQNGKRSSGYILTRHNNKSSIDPLIGRAHFQTMRLNTINSDTNRLNKLLQTNRPFIYVQDNAFNFTVRYIQP